MIGTRAQAHLVLSGFYHQTEQTKGLRTRTRLNLRPSLDQFEKNPFWVYQEGQVCPDGQSEQDPRTGTDSQLMAGQKDMEEKSVCI